MVIYTVIILLPQGFYILCAGFFFRSIRFLHANLARLCIPIQQRSRLQTLVSSYHSTTSAQRTPSVDSCANSQCFPGLLERGHLSAKSIRGARNENMENMENLNSRQHLKRENRNERCIEERESQILYILHILTPT